MFYEILQDGFHTPLTATQIADLFHAGRVGRHTRCKPERDKEWRTVDELFPLLKYPSARQFVYEPAQSVIPAESRRSIAIGATVAGALGIVLILYFCFHEDRSAVRPTVTREAPTSWSRVAPHSRSFTTTAQFTPASNTAPQRYQTTIAPVVSAEETHQQQALVRQAEQQRLAEQAQLNQIRAEQDRAAKERLLLEQEKAAGRDHHVPLDEWQVVDVGGQPVSVKIHDNDVTSFDVWINYGLRREVKKEKGITHSGTDETLIYSNGRAALYYVWEISKLNHCMLRVRES